MIGIIGGSGLYSIEGLKVKEERIVKTPFGEPSSPLVLGEIEGREVVFLARHGRDHSFPPHLVPYRANVWALREMGVERILAILAVGGINRSFRAGDFVVVDNLLDFTKGRRATFYEGKFSPQVSGTGRPEELIRGKKVVHIDMSEPYCPQMRDALKRILERKGFRYHSCGTYVCTEGPRFETSAEIRMFSLLGGDVVGMTGYPEVALARELEMCYAGLAVVANPAAGLHTEKLTAEEVLELMAKKEEEVKSVIVDLIRELPPQRTCPCPSILEGSEVD